jgi:hypothetical protein
MENIATDLYTLQNTSLQSDDVRHLGLVLPFQTEFTLASTYHDQIFGRDTAREVSTYTAYNEFTPGCLFVAITPTDYERYSRLRQSMASGLKNHAIVHETAKTFIEENGLYVVPERHQLHAGLIYLYDDMHKVHPSYLRVVSLIRR